ncbi:MAG: cell division protein FtsZ [Muribaculaceae bacterium]|nr:cell division protein FtsZ [Muribaculaceae bacterium]
MSNENMSPDDLRYIDKYNQPDYEPDRIMVIGVGGGGSNAVNHMFKQNTQCVSFVVINTDQQALRRSPVPTKVLIGPTVTKGRGAGNVPEKAFQAAEESAAEIDKLFTDETDMVFITASMGGGTGTGAAPVVARIARERGLLTVGIVTIPFLFEGMKKINKALAGAEEMSKYVDTILVINNERLSEIYPSLRFEDAFAKADDTLSTAARSIAEIITNDGYINLDFNDVDTTLRNAGTALISVGYGEGENRVTNAINDALHSPLLKNANVFSSKRLLFNLCYSREAEQAFKAEEARELSAFITKIDSQVEVDVIWGITYDETLGNRVKFTILAAGFDASDSDTQQTSRTETAAAVQTPPTEPQRIDKEKIAGYYGHEKIDDLQRLKEQQRYIILNPDQIDNDEIIETLERTPAYNRDKKMAAGGIKAPGQAVPRAMSQNDDSRRDDSRQGGGQQRPGNNVVFFSDDE